MDKETLKNEINSLPKFEKRDVQVADPEGNFVLQTKKAICEVDGDQAYAYVSPEYNLVQFHEVFLPIVNDIDGDAICGLANYGGYASVRLFPKLEALQDGLDSFGICASNSVDLSSAITVKFIIRHGNDWTFTMPASIAGLKKQHTGDAKNVVKNYVAMVGKVKDHWRQIVTEFPKYRVVRQIKGDEATSVLELGTIADKLDLGTRLTKKITEKYDAETADNKVYTLWDFIIMVLGEVTNANYKSEVHKEKKVDKICEAIFGFAFTLGI